jgi:hypothetical protein
MRRRRRRRGRRGRRRFNVGRMLVLNTPPAVVQAHALSYVLSAVARGERVTAVVLRFPSLGFFHNAVPTLGVVTRIHAHAMDGLIRGIRAPGLEKVDVRGIHAAHEVDHGLVPHRNVAPRPGSPPLPKAPLAQSHCRVLFLLSNPVPRTALSVVLSLLGFHKTTTFPPAVVSATPQMSEGAPKLPATRPPPQHSRRPLC